MNRSSFDEKLVELVVNHRFLWDRSDEEFKNAIRRELTWQEIAGSLDQTVDHCKRRWRNIRDHYKKVKQQESNLPTGYPVSRKRASYWNVLRFIDSVEDVGEAASKPKKCGDSSADAQNEGTLEIKEENAESEETDGPSLKEPLSGMIRKMRNKRRVERFSPTIGRTRNRRGLSHQARSNHLTREAEERLLRKIVLEKGEVDDDIDLFLKGIGATIKTFDKELRAVVKSDIFTLVSKYEINFIRGQTVTQTFGNEQEYSADEQPFHYLELQQ